MSCIVCGKPWRECVCPDVEFMPLFGRLLYVIEVATDGPTPNCYNADDNEFVALARATTYPLREAARAVIDAFPMDYILQAIPHMTREDFYRARPILETKLPTGEIIRNRVEGIGPNGETL